MKLKLGDVVTYASNSYYRDAVGTIVEIQQPEPMDFSLGVATWSITMGPYYYVRWRSPHWDARVTSHLEHELTISALSVVQELPHDVQSGG